MSMDHYAETNRSEFRGERSRKLLKASKTITAFQKKYYQDVKERAAQGEPVIWTNVGLPYEIMYAMDLPIIFNLHWSALLSAKQLSPYYLDVLNRHGYFRDLCRYCSLPLGYFLDKDPGKAPWGGVPKPSAVVVDAADDPQIRIYELIAKELNIPIYLFDRTAPYEIPKGVWCESLESIEAESYRETERLDFQMRETESLISFLENLCGRSLSEVKLRETLETSNRHFDYIRQVLELTTRKPCPISIADHMPNVINTQFFRGHPLGLEHAKLLYEEVQARVDQGLSACPNERIRLMHMVVPTWFSPGFFNSFEEKYGAVFVWMVYFAIVQQLHRYDLKDPIKALAGRYVGYTEVGLLPPYWPQWVVHWAKKCHIDAAVYQVADSCRMLSGPMRLTIKALEDIGIPTLEMRSDYVDARDWDDDRMKSQLATFIETLL
jgi:benzoyl-CoA reductase subunit B